MPGRGRRVDDRTITRRYLELLKALGEADGMRSGWKGAAAEFLDVSTAHLSRIVNRKRLATNELAGRAAIAAGVPYDALVSSEPLPREICERAALAFREHRGLVRALNEVVEEPPRAAAVPDTAGEGELETSAVVVARRVQAAVVRGASVEWDDLEALERALADMAPVREYLAARDYMDRLEGLSLRSVDTGVAGRLATALLAQLMRSPPATGSMGGDQDEEGAGS